MMPIEQFLILLAVTLGAWPLANDPDNAAAAVLRDSFAQGPDPDASQRRAPQGLIPGDWSDIRAVWDASRHAAFPVDGGWRARNPGQSWHTLFDRRGIRVRPDGAGWEWGLELRSWGFEKVERPVGEPLHTSADGQLVRYAWGGGLEEWFVNDNRGLEHGYTVLERPARAGATEDAWLTFALAVRGGLGAEVDSDGRGVRFVDGNGTVVLTYTGLIVLDADGREIDARFDRAPDGLLLSVDERDARYPLMIDPVAQQAYLKASNPESLDDFGWSVAIAGDTAVISAIGEDSSATGVNGNQTSNGASESGAAYVFVRSGSSWSPQAYLKASNTGALDQFGWSVAISGDTIVIGAPAEDSSATGVGGDQTDNSANSCGAAYVFVRSGATWSQQAYLKASNAEANDQFGRMVAVSGDTIVVGAWLEDGVTGAAYVFVRSGSTWSEQAYLKGSNTQAGDQFGESVAVWDDTVAVGAPSEDSNATGVDGDQSSNGASHSGAVYVFVRSGSSWSQQAYVKASNTEAGDNFGQAMGLSGDTLLVGAPNEDSSATGVNGDQENSGAAFSGAAYVFERCGSTWSQQAYLKASNTGASDQFGLALAISGNAALVGSGVEDSNAIGVNGNGANNAALNSGAAYVFVRRGSIWEHHAYLKASNAAPVDVFGWSVGMSGGTALIGALGEDSAAQGVNGDQGNNSLTQAGAAYALQICPEAVVAVRNAGSNPASYAASPAVLGGTFTATVDNNLAGQATSLLFAFDTPTAILLSGGQTLLCVDFGSGELFTGGSLSPSSSAGGVDGFSLAVPDLPVLAGVLACSQAIQFGNPPFVLSNAQDLTIGSF